MTALRAQQALVQFRLIAQEQETFAVGIEAPDGIDTRRESELRQRAIGRAVGCKAREHTARFMERDQHARNRKTQRRWKGSLKLNPRAAHADPLLECGDLSPLSPPGRLVGLAVPRSAARRTITRAHPSTATSRLPKAVTSHRTPKTGRSGRSRRSF